MEGGSKDDTECLGFMRRYLKYYSARERGKKRYRLKCSVCMMAQPRTSKSRMELQAKVHRRIEGRRITNRVPILTVPKSFRSSPSNPTVRHD